VCRPTCQLLMTPSCLSARAPRSPGSFRLGLRAHGAAQEMAVAPTAVLPALTHSRRVFPATQPFPARQSSLSVRCRAFGQDDRAREAAKKALMGALGGKENVLAVNDAATARRLAGGGGSGGGGGRGGGGGGGGDGGKRKRELLSTLQAVAIVAGGLLLINSWKQLLALLVNLVFYVLRISPSGPVEAPAANVSAIDNISRWADDEEEDKP